MKKFDAINFAFRDYKDAFDKFREYERLHGSENVQMVVSEHPYSAGYWIESSNVQVYRVTDHKYTRQEVYDLEIRVEKGIVEKGNFHNGIIL